jgi:uncharacterized damage-inducible protein DinB
VADDLPEPWLRGSLEEIHPLIRPVFFSFTQVREDLERYVLPLSKQQIWSTAGGASVGFHLRHLAGSVDRLTTYLLGNQLNEKQLAFIRSEGSGSEGPDELLSLIGEALRKSEAQLQTLNPEDLFAERFVGRKKLPTTVLGLLTHLAEHTQRHLGQIITSSKILQQTG